MNWLEIPPLPAWIATAKKTVRDHQPWRAEADHAMCTAGKKEGTPIELDGKRYRNVKEAVAVTGIRPGLIYELLRKGGAEWKR